MMKMKKKEKDEGGGRITMKNFEKNKGSFNENSKKKKNAVRRKHEKGEKKKKGVFVKELRKIVLVKERKNVSNIAKGWSKKQATDSRTKDAGLFGLKKHTDKKLRRAMKRKKGGGEAFQNWIRKEDESKNSFPI